MKDCSPAIAMAEGGVQQACTELQRLTSWIIMTNSWLSLGVNENTISRYMRQGGALLIPIQAGLPKL